MTITAVLPMRKGSQRVLDKNTTALPGFPFGLAEIKIRQLIRTSAFKTILVDTDIESIPQIIDYIFDGGGSPSEADRERVIVSMRPEKYASSTISTDEYIKYIIPRIETTHFLWTHSTSPFFGTNSYARFVEAYLSNLSRFDSLMTVTELREYIWCDGKPYNYDPDKIKWPPTQSLSPLEIINSAAFIVGTDVAKSTGNRIGSYVGTFPTSQLEGFDVDWPDQFDFVKLALSAGYSVL